MSRPLEQAMVREAMKILGVTADSDPATVAHAFRRLARTTHPDVSGDPDSAAEFASAASAYRLLTARTRERDQLRSEREPQPRSAPTQRRHGVPVVPPVVASPVYFRPSRPTPATTRHDNGGS